MIFEKKGQVLGLGAADAWDDTRVSLCSVMYKDNLFYIYYSGYCGSNYRIGLATSPDGVTFTKQGQVLDLGAGGAWDDVHVMTPSILYKDNLFYIYYSGYCGSNYRIGLATSPDGVTFTKQGQVLDLGAGGAWDDEAVGVSTVIYKDNLFYMYYWGNEDSVFKIGLATSPDGVTFTKQGIVLDPLYPQTPAYFNTINTGVIYRINLFYMFYSYLVGGNYQVHLATSPDGVTFTKQGKILDTGGAGAWDEVRAVGCDVIYKDNLFYLYYTGVHSNSFTIGLAVSGCEPLRPHEFRVNAATGDMNFPLGLNDGTWG